MPNHTATKPNHVFLFNACMIITGNILTFMVFWLMQINLSWLAFAMTQSSWRLGLLGFMLNLPILLAIPIGGAYSDKISRKFIMASCQLLYLIPNFILFALLYTKHISYWNMLITGLCYGACFGFARPASDATIYDISQNDRQLKITTSINACSSQVAMAAAPYFSQFIIREFGLHSIFIACTLFNLLAALAFIQLRRLPHALKNPERLHTAIASGFRYLFANRELLLFMLMVSLTLGVIISLQFQYPAIIEEFFDGNKKDLYYFYFSSAIGGLTGASIIILVIKNLSQRSLLVGLNAALFLQGAAIITLAWQHHINWAYPLVFAIDLTGIAGTILGTLGIQSLTDDAYRGRILSLLGLARIGTIPIMSLIIGALVSFLDLSWGISLFGIFYILLVVLFILVNKN